MSRSCLRLCLLLLPLLLLGRGVGFAEDSPKDPAPVAEENLLGVAPEADYNATLAVNVGSQSLKLPIHRERPRANRIPKHYYHQPLFAFILREEAVAGYPQIVQEVDAVTDPTGKIRMRFNMLLSSNDLCRRCEPEVAEQDSEFLASNGVKGSEVKVHPWPIQHLVAVCHIRGDQKQILATASTGSLARTPEVAEFWLAFPPAEAARFLSLVHADKEAIEFTFYFTFTGQTLQSGSKKVNALQSAEVLVSQGLSSEQLDNQAPIYQWDVARVSELVSASLDTQMSAEGADVLNILQAQSTNLALKLFEAAPVVELKDLEADPALTAQLAAYLKPHLETALVSEGVTTGVVETKEKEKGDTTQTGGGISLLGLHFGTDSQTTKRVMDRIQKSSGVSLQNVAGTEQYKPHKIKSFKLRSGWKQVATTETVAISLATGKFQRYYPSSPVRPQFTAQAVADDLARTHDKRRADLSALFPAGFVTVYPGRDVAELENFGWMLCDGRPLKKDLYPELFLALGTDWGTGKGRPNTEDKPGDFNLPDLRGQFLRGADADGAVGEKRGVGSYQEDAFQLHGHSGVTDNSGGHGHEVAVPYSAGSLSYENGFFVPANGGGIHLSRQQGSVTPSSRIDRDVIIPAMDLGKNSSQNQYSSMLGGHHTWFGYQWRDDMKAQGSTTDPSGGTHQHAVQVDAVTGADPRTASETRPKNAAVNWIIRVR